MFLICSKGFKIDFKNRKWNYPNRKWNYFSHFQASNQKTSFTKYFSFDPMGSKLIFKTGNGIISPSSRPSIKKLLLHNVYHFHLFLHIFNFLKTFFNYFQLFSPILTYLDLHESFAAYSIVRLFILELQDSMSSWSD